MEVCVGRPTPESPIPIGREFIPSSRGGRL